MNEYSIIDGFTVSYDHLDRMQRRVLTRESWVSKAEFQKESADEQFSFYRWLLVQCGELADLI